MKYAKTAYLDQIFHFCLYMQIKGGLDQDQAVDCLKENKDQNLTRLVICTCY